MTDLLDLVPALERQLRRYKSSDDTESTFAAYLADAVQALMLRWDRLYTVTFQGPMTYLVSPNIAQQDNRPIILMASIIYKSAFGSGFAAYTDGDFSFVPIRGTTNPIDLDRKELLAYISDKPRLSAPSTAPLRGFAYVLNRESYNNFLNGGWLSGLPSGWKTDGMV